MNFQEISDSFSSLDPENIGSWPFAVRVIICILCFSLIVGGVHYFKVSESLILKETSIQKEKELLEEFKKKASDAANLEALKIQMAEMYQTFGVLLRQLPEDTEAAGLLEDISQIGEDSGLEFEAIQFGNENIAEFYAVLPIDITVRGTYHAFGSFISGVAALPRIVTLHDFNIVKPENSNGLLTMSIIARTYRYTKAAGSVDFSTIVNEGSAPTDPASDNSENNSAVTTEESVNGAVLENTATGNSTEENNSIENASEEIPIVEESDSIIDDSMSNDMQNSESSDASLNPNENISTENNNSVPNMSSDSQSDMAPANDEVITKDSDVEFQEGSEKKSEGRAL
ncbi:MAG: type 4a pilus biogenesis protein PilO [Pseudomonadota bacterium]